MNDVLRSINSELPRCGYQVNKEAIKTSAGPPMWVKHLLQTAGLKWVPMHTPHLPDACWHFCLEKAAIPSTVFYGLSLETGWANGLAAAPGPGAWLFSWQDLAQQRNSMCSKAQQLPPPLSPPPLAFLRRCSRHCFASLHMSPFHSLSRLPEEAREQENGLRQQWQKEEVKKKLVRRGGWRLGVVVTVVWVGAHD